MLDFSGRLNETMKINSSAIPVMAGILLVMISGCSSSLQSDDLTSISDCMRYVAISPDPRAAALLGEIADGARMLATERELADVQGIPLTRDMRMPPSARNAATLYKQWRALQRERNFSTPNYASPMGYGYRYTPAQLEAVREILAAHKPEFNLLIRAINDPVWAFPAGGAVDFGSPSVMIAK